MLASKAIRCVRAGSAVLIPREALDDYLGNRPAKPCACREPLYHRRADVARMLSVSVRKLDSMLKAGSLRYRRDGHSVLISKSDLTRFLKEIHA